MANLRKAEALFGELVEGELVYLNNVVCFLDVLEPSCGGYPVSRSNLIWTMLSASLLYLIHTKLRIFSGLAMGPSWWTSMSATSWGQRWPQWQLPGRPKACKYSFKLFYHSIYRLAVDSHKYIFLDFYRDTFSGQQCSSRCRWGHECPPRVGVGDDLNDNCRAGPKPVSITLNYFINN